jgi:hypothetical protein
LDNNEEGSEDNSENEDPDDPWKISAEQRGWYLSLFLRLQPDFEGFIEGITLLTDLFDPVVMDFQINLCRKVTMNLAVCWKN